jgi:hypothetical protein
MKEKNGDELSMARARLTKAEARASTLEDTIASKKKENDELVAICEELIKKIDRNKDLS